MNHLPDTITPGQILPAVQICPFGTFKAAAHEPGSEPPQQLCDQTAFEQLIADWQERGAPEILMDFEHQSEADSVTSDTRAAAWVSNLAIDGERGLVGDFKFTDDGAEAVSNRRLRFLSPTWFTDMAGRPARLTSIALTNRPNIRTSPILNKAPGEQGANQPPAPTSSLGGKPQNTTTHTMDIEKLKQALGLPPEATEEQILAAIQEGQAAKTEAADLKAARDKECLEREAEEFANKHCKKCNKEVLKAQYIANKAVAQALVDGIPDAPSADAPQKILNKATNPKPLEDLVLQRNKALADYRAAHGNCDFATAWNACRVTTPELFND